MSLAITLNLIAIIVVVGGWSAAVWAFYKHLGDPHEQADRRQQPKVIQSLDASSEPERVLAGSHAA